MPKDNNADNTELTDNIKQTSVESKPKVVRKKPADSTKKVTKPKDTTTDTKAKKAAQPKPDSTKSPAAKSEKPKVEKIKVTKPKVEKVEKPKSRKVSTEDFLRENDDETGPAFKPRKRVSAVLILIITFLLISATATVLVVTLGNRGHRTSSVRVEVTPIMVTNNTDSVELTKPTIVNLTNEDGTKSAAGTAIDVEIQPNQYVMYQYKLNNKTEFDVDFEITIPDLDNTNFYITYTDTAIREANEPYDLIVMDYNDRITGTLGKFKEKFVVVYFKINNLELDASIQGELTLTLSMV